MIGDEQNSGICKPVVHLAQPPKMDGIQNFVNAYAATAAGGTTGQNRVAPGHPQADRGHGRLPHRLTHGEKRRPPAR